MIVMTFKENLAKKLNLRLEVHLLGHIILYQLWIKTYLLNALKIESLPSVKDIFNTILIIRIWTD